MRRRPLLSPLALACLLAGLAPLGCAAADAPATPTPSPVADADSKAVLNKADELLKRSQPNSAYELLAPLEDERAGDPDFDYLLGLSALESGQAGRAAFAFERCLAADPKNGPCRVQMARTHFALGENSSARQELETVEKSQPPAEVQTLVRQYLGSIAQSEASQQRHVTAYAQVGLGYDSNVTATTDSKQVALPVFGGLPFTLTGLSTRQDDNFQQGEAGVGLQYTLSPAWTLLSEASVRGRGYTEVDQFDSVITAGNIGAAYHVGPQVAQVKLQLEDYRLDSNAFRSLYGVLGQYQYALDENSAFTSFAQASHLDYHVLGRSGGQGMPDAARYTLGLGYSQALSRTAVFYGGLYAGQESSEGQQKSLDQDFQGLRLGGSLALSNTLRLTSALSVEKRKFGGIDSIFLVTRNDTETGVSLGAVYEPAPHFSVRPNYTYSNSNSNITLDDYDRHVVSVDLRYEL